MFEVSSLTLVYAIIQNFLGLYFVFLGWGLLGIVYGWLVGLSIASFIGFALTNRYLGISRETYPTKPLIKYSFPLYTSQILTFLASWIDQIFILSFVGAIYDLAKAKEMLGIYYVAVRASVVPSLVFSSALTVLFPLLSELYARNGVNSMKKAFHFSTRYAALIGFPTIIGLATLAYPIVVLFAGQEYVDAALPLTIICISSLPTTLGVATTAILMAMERTKAASLIVITSIISEILALYIALAYLNLGIIGAAISRVVLAIVGLILGLALLKKNPGISFDKEALWKGIASCVVMVFAIVVLDIVRQFFTSSYQFLVIRLSLLPIYVVVGAIAYFISLVALKTIKRRDTELAYEYLPNGLKPIAKLVERIARVK